MATKPCAGQRQGLFLPTRDAHVSPPRVVARWTQLSPGQQHLVVLGGLAKLQLQTLQRLLQRLLLLLLALVEELLPLQQGLVLRQEPAGDVLPRGEHGYSAHGAAAGCRPWPQGAFCTVDLCRLTAWRKAAPSLPWVLPEKGSSLTQRQEHCAAALAFSIFSITMASCSYWDLAASSLAPGVGGKRQGRTPAAAPASSPLHPTRHSPTTGSSGCRGGKSSSSSYLACCKDVHCHPLSCWHPGGAGPAAGPTHGLLPLMPAHSPDCTGPPTKLFSAAFPLLPSARAGRWPLSGWPDSGSRAASL